MPKLIDLAIALLALALLALTAAVLLKVLGYDPVQDLKDEVWPQRQEAPACPPPASTGERAYG